MKPYFSTLKHLITLVFCITILSCGNNPLEVDVSDVKIDFKVTRFDRIYFNIQMELLQKMWENYTPSMACFFSTLLRV